MNIGCDILKIARVSKLGDKFKLRYFTPDEIAYCKAKSVNTDSSFAGIFCAKEAFLKVVGVGMGNFVQMKDIEISHDENGRPSINYLGEISEILVLNYDVSISHDGGFAMAVVVAW